ncbi:hypothetical protein FORC88_2138 [Salmonella enterica subsp. enterica serovar Typhimurium]|uniref:Uncharacterized protein n=3 Tax=Salmonella enterica I TaxID=59201 RepID=A0A0N1QSA4_SALSV|nr:hypothetical protein SeSA_A1896 [Salmonella enterica subsp. enterica serovar Schwarzengrund str. CVM19633]AJQ74299.1 hypothetical protein AW67_23900 [Salmonella enterica subsp. enterica serovar Montevideo str. USDA-ARS-USMARC-1903]EDY28608.1 hypothetical protein SeSB_A1736 [Salmonella enterica subsp. enterica serovar Schwarzengrund str. SL480]EHB41549.1 hypothetical protein SEENIN0B_01407 [Salmonella enterica subsp. enterica serovar Infantis str. SARB27]EHC37657.1 hypothetical protein SeGA_1
MLIPAHAGKNGQEVRKNGQEVSLHARAIFFCYIAEYISVLQ